MNEPYDREGVANAHYEAMAAGFPPEYVDAARVTRDITCGFSASEAARREMLRLNKDYVWEYRWR